MFTNVKFSLFIFVTQYLFMELNKSILELFNRCKSPHLYHRYITNFHIEPLLKNLSESFEVNQIGSSVNGLPIYGVKVGTGQKKVLMWSQMHGNESTTTKALFDMFYSMDSQLLNEVVDNCTLYIVPILNPDGAKAYTRVNANNIDLNRDAQNLTQPESLVLKDVYDTFKPDFCFNLHGQRTIFSAGNNNKVATLSFLAPAQDSECTITETRKKAMEVISVINASLQKEIPNQIGVYDDAYNINCVGDTLQTLNIPTILFEAGHYKEDYEREEVRRLIYMSLLVSLKYIASNDVLGSMFESYLNIPENKKLFYDIIIRNASVLKGEETVKTDIAVQYLERLDNEKVVFLPKIEKISDLTGFYAHKELDANNNAVLDVSGAQLKIDSENDFVLIDNELFSLKVDKKR